MTHSQHHMCPCVYMCVYMCVGVIFIRTVLYPKGPVRPLASKQVSATALTPAQKNQLKEAGGTFK